MSYWLPASIRDTAVQGLELAPITMSLLDLLLEIEYLDMDEAQLLRELCSLTGGCSIY
jgi:hypothetical protein